MNVRVIPLLGIMLLGAAAAGTAQNRLPSTPQTLSLEDALGLAERYNPSYLRTANDRGPAAWGVRNAYAAFIPNLTASSSATFRGAGVQRFLTTEFRQPSATIGSSYNLTLNWTLDGNTLLQPGVQKAALSATDASIDAALMALRTGVVQQYVAVLEAQAQVELQERQVERNVENLRLSQARFDVGQVTMIDVRQAEVAKGQSDVGLLQARQSVIVETLRLFQQMGVPAPEDPTLVTLSDTFPVVEPTWKLEELLAEADAFNPDVGALRAQETSAEWAERSVKSRWLPSVSLGATWSGFTQQFTNGDFLLEGAQTGAVASIAACNDANIINQDLILRLGLDRTIVPDCTAAFGLSSDAQASILAGNSVFPFNFTNNPFQAQLSIRLPIFDQFDRNLRISQASAAAEDAQEFRRARELLVRTDVSQQYYGLLANYESIAIQANNRVLAQDGLRLATERYRVGVGTFFELLDAQLAAQQAEADYVTATFDYHRSLVSLEAAVGHRLR
ncbi:MAG: TolC family protein [Gemmatimonadetes bacterium]|nr:TolC family protein [Gemmatimonadota bacterium]